MRLKLTERIRTHEARQMMWPVTIVSRHYGPSLETRYYTTFDTMEVTVDSILYEKERGVGQDG